MNSSKPLRGKGIPKKKGEPKKNAERRENSLASRGDILRRKTRPSKTRANPLPLPKKFANGKTQSLGRKN